MVPAYRGTCNNKVPFQNQTNATLPQNLFEVERNVVALDYSEIKIQSFALQAEISKPIA